MARVLVGVLWTGAIDIAGPDLTGVFDVFAANARGVFHVAVRSRRSHSAHLDAGRGLGLVLKGAGSFRWAPRALGRNRAVLRFGGRLDHHRVVNLIACSRGFRRSTSLRHFGRAGT